MTPLRQEQELQYYVISRNNKSNILAMLYDYQQAVYNNNNNNKNIHAKKDRKHRKRPAMQNVDGGLVLSIHFQN